jgi:hypothetical protein
VKYRAQIGCSRRKLATEAGWHRSRDTGELYDAGDVEAIRRHHVALDGKALAAAALQYRFPHGQRIVREDPKARRSCERLPGRSFRGHGDALAQLKLGLADQAAAPWRRSMVPIAT